jgi:hypothetical protein
MPKVAQMLDAGWEVRIIKNVFGNYFAAARHDKAEIIERANASLKKWLLANGWTDDLIESFLDADEINTDDFTPEQALTRLAYKVHGEIIAT